MSKAGSVSILQEGGWLESSGMLRCVVLNISSKKINLLMHRGKFQSFKSSQKTAPFSFYLQIHLWVSIKVDWLFLLKIE